MIGVASLSLAACGSGGEENEDDKKKIKDQAAEIQRITARNEKLEAEKEELEEEKEGLERTISQHETDPSRKSTLDTREQQLRTREQQLRTREQEQQQREQASTNFAGFGDTEIAKIGNLIYESQDPRSRLALRYLNTQSGVAGGGFPHHTILKLEGDRNTKIINVIPTLNSSGQFDNYKVNFHNPGTLTEAKLGSHTYWHYADKPTSANQLFGFDKSSYTATSLDLGLAGDNWDSKILKAEVDANGDNSKDATIHVELAAGWPTTTGAAEERSVQWLTYGYWLQVPKDISSFKDYNVGAFSNNNYVFHNLRTVVGTATYKGGLLGLHTSLKDNKTKLSRLTGKVTLTADFDNHITGGTGIMRFLADDLKLDGEKVSGQMTFFADKLGNSANYINAVGVNIDGINYRTVGGYVFTGFTYDPNTIAPNGVTGVMKGKSDISNDSSFVAGWGATRTE